MEEMKVKFYKDFLKNRESILNENYPAGAKNDPNAPWNQKDIEVERKEKGESPASLLFELCGTDQEFALFKDKKNPKDLYISYIEDPERIGLEEYRGFRREATGERDEDGDGQYETTYEDTFEDSDIENWAFDNISREDIGEGLDAWESGDFLTVKLDQELAKELYEDFARFSSKKYRSGSKHFKGMPPRSILLQYNDMMDDIKESFPSVESEWRD